MGLRRFKRKRTVNVESPEKIKKFQVEESYASSQDSSDSETSESSCAWSERDSDGEELPDSANISFQTANTEYTQQRGLRKNVKLTMLYQDELFVLQENGNTLNRGSPNTAPSREFVLCDDGSVEDPVAGAKVMSAGDHDFIDPADSDDSIPVYESNSDSDSEPPLNTVDAAFPEDTRILTKAEIFGEQDQQELAHANMAKHEDEDDGFNLGSLTPDPLQCQEPMPHLDAVAPDQDQFVFIATLEQIKDFLLQADILQYVPSGSQIQEVANKVIFHHAAGRTYNTGELFKRTLKLARKLLRTKPQGVGQHWHCFGCCTTRRHCDRTRCVTENCVQKTVACDYCQKCTHCQLQKNCKSCRSVTQHKISVYTGIGIHVDCITCCKDQQQAAGVKLEVKPEVKFEATNCEAFIDLT